MRYSVEPVTLPSDHPCWPSLNCYKIRDLESNYLMPSIYLDHQDVTFRVEQMNKEVVE